MLCRLLQEVILSAFAHWPQKSKKLLQNDSEKPAIRIAGKAVDIIQAENKRTSFLIDRFASAFHQDAELN
jgi:hypothetical protein